MILDICHHLYFPQSSAGLHRQGECLSGAFYWNDFLRLAKECGFQDPRLVKDDKIVIQNKRIEEVVGHIDFYSATYRLFKIEGLEPECEDYGQVGGV
jgi:hypothetical protein